MSSNPTNANPTYYHKIFLPPAIAPPQQPRLARFWSVKNQEKRQTKTEEATVVGTYEEKVIDTTPPPPGQDGEPENEPQPQIHPEASTSGGDKLGLFDVCPSVTNAQAFNRAMGQAPSGNTAFGSRSTIPLQSSMNLPSLPHAPVEGFPIPTWSFQESYETIVSSQVRYYADPYTAPAVAPYPSVTDRITGQSASGGAILHDGAYENDPGVTYCVTGQSASSGAVPHDDGYDIDRVASTPMPQDPIIFQHPPTAVSANGADNVQPSGSFTSQPAPGWRPGGIKWRNVQSWAECVALKTNETHGSTQRPSRHIDTTPTPGANTGVNTLPARVPSPDETTTATPRPLRVMNVTPGHTATPRPAANTQPVQEAQASTPTFDVDAMVTRAYDETAQAAQEIDNQTTTRLTELAVVVTERRLNTPPPHKERPDTPTTAMAVDHLLREDMRRGFYHLLKMAIQPRYVAEPAPALLPKGTEANLKLWGSKVEETAVAEVVAEVVADARGVHLWQPRAWGMRHIADIQRMEDIADIFAENFIKPYVPGFRG